MRMLPIVREETGCAADIIGLDPHAPVAVTGGGGFRSSTAGSLLLAHGYTRVYNLAGGMDARQLAGLPVA